MTNKFKFGDHVHVAFPHWRDADEIGVVLGSSRGVNNVQFENGGYTGYVPDEYLTLATDWVKCSERMPELNVPVLVHTGSGMRIDKAYDFGDGVSFYEDLYGEFTHWMPLPYMSEVKE